MVDDVPSLAVVGVWRALGKNTSGYQRVVTSRPVRDRGVHSSGAAAEERRLAAVDGAISCGTVGVHCCSRPAADDGRRRRRDDTGSSGTTAVPRPPRSHDRSTVVRRRPVQRFPCPPAAVLGGVGSQFSAVVMVVVQAPVGRRTVRIRSIRFSVVDGRQSSSRSAAARLVVVAAVVRRRTDALPSAVVGQALVGRRKVRISSIHFSVVDGRRPGGAALSSSSSGPHSSGRVVVLISVVVPQAVPLVEPPPHPVVGVVDGGRTTSASQFLNSSTADDGQSCGISGNGRRELLHSVAVLGPQAAVVVLGPQGAAAVVVLGPRDDGPARARPFWTPATGPSGRTTTTTTERRWPLLLLLR